uniref:Uncharacterized protein n=1 Tax=Arundo donax TaxID=35708 RepID=A0A0A9C6G3_ARUDO
MGSFHEFWWDETIRHITLRNVLVRINLFHSSNQTSGSSLELGQHPISQTKHPTSLFCQMSKAYLSIIFTSEPGARVSFFLFSRGLTICNQSIAELIFQSYTN